MDVNWIAILSAGSGGIAALLARRFMTFTSARNLVSLNFAFLFLMMLPAAPFFWHFRLTSQAVWIFLLAAVVDALANIFYFYAFERLSAVTASAIMALSPLFTLALQPLFRGASPLQVVNIIGIAVVVLGLILLTRRNDSIVETPGRKWVPLIFPVMAAVLFGVNVYPIQVLLINGWTNPYTYYFLRAAVVTLVTAAVLRPRLDWVDIRKAGLISGRLVFVIAQWLLLLIALTRGNPAVVKTLSDTSPLFVMALSWLILREPVGKWQAAGVVMTLAGMVLALR